MYLLPQNSAPVNNRKWNLGRMGRMGCGCSARGISVPPAKRLGLGRLGDYTYQSALDTINASQNIITTRGQSGQTIIVDQNTWLSMDPVSGEIWEATSSGNVSLGTGPSLAVAPATSPSSGSTTTTPAPAVGVPAGSSFTYTVQWASSLTNISGPSQILAAVTQLLAQRKIAVDSSSIPATILGQATGFTIVGHTTLDRAQWADIQGDIDSAVAQAGRQKTSSSLTPGATGIGPMGWLQSNWPTLALIGGGLLLVKEL